MATELKGAKATWLSGLSWGSVPDWLVLIVAVAGTLLALRQLAGSLQANQAYLRAEQGAQLMAIDDKFVVELKASRRALALLKLACELQVGSDPLQVSALAAQRLNFLYAKRRQAYSLDAAERKIGQVADEEYFTLMQFPMFIETVGVLTGERLASEVTVLRLYDAAIHTAMGLVLDHVVWRRLKDGNPSLLENAGLVPEKWQKSCRCGSVAGSKAMNAFAFTRGLYRA